MPASSNTSKSAALLTAKEAAERLKVTENGLAKMRGAGGGPPFILIGRRVRYGEDDLVHWLSARTYTSLPPKATPTPTNDQ